jgi:hypothetical protein
MALMIGGHEVSIVYHHWICATRGREQDHRRGADMARRSVPMQAIRQTVSPEAMLQVPEIWLHRNPVYGANRMWLMR